MADKHEHLFIVRRSNIPRCVVCHESALVVLQQTEQQLAQARALLEAIPEPVYDDDGYWCCTCCEAIYPKQLQRGPQRHESTCPWMQACTFLAQNGVS